MPAMLRSALLVLLCALLAYGLILLAGWHGSDCRAMLGETGAPMQWIVGSRC